MRIKTQHSIKCSSFAFIFLIANVCKIMGQVSKFRHVCFLKHYQFQNRKPSFYTTNSLNLHVPANPYDMYVQHNSR